MTNDKSETLLREAMQPDPSAERRTAILIHIETFQARLAELLEQWRRKTEPVDDIEAAIDQNDDEG